MHATHNYSGHLKIPGKLMVLLCMIGLSVLNRFRRVSLEFSKSFKFQEDTFLNRAPTPRHRSARTSTSTTPPSSPRPSRTALAAAG